MKRELVLQAASAMFNERGFAATSLSDVADRLQVTKPTIYYYFQSKDDVLFECLRKGMEHLTAAAAEARALDGDGRARLAALLRSYLQIITVGYGGCAARTSDYELSPENRQEFRRLKRDYDNTIRKFIQDGVEDGSLVAPDVRLASFALAGAINWITRWYNPAGAMTAGDIGEKIVDMMLAGLAPRGPTV